MLGIPGAGKTSISEHISEITGAVHISSDEFRKHMFDKPEDISETEHFQTYNMLNYITSQILKSGKDVIYDANLNRREHRDEKYDICKRVGAECKLIYVKTSIETAKKRATEQADRHPEHRPFGNMSIENFERLVAQMEEPTSDENPIVIDGDHIDLKEIKKAIS